MNAKVRQSAPEPNSGGYPRFRVIPPDTLRPGHDILAEAPDLPADLASADPTTISSPRLGRCTEQSVTLLRRSPSKSAEVRLPRDGRTSARFLS
jgi:hypothetical protein